MKIAFEKMRPESLLVLQNVAYKENISALKRTKTFKQWKHWQVWKAFKAPHPGSRAAAQEEGNPSWSKDSTTDLQILCSGKDITVCTLPKASV